MEQLEYFIKLALFSGKAFLVVLFVMALTTLMLSFRVWFAIWISAPILSVSFGVMFPIVISFFFPGLLCLQFFVISLIGCYLFALNKLLRAK